MYEAVIGYTLDDECVAWGSGDTAEAAIRDAVEWFIANVSDCIEPDDYEATVYCEPLTRDRPDGDGEVYAWQDRAIATVYIDHRGRWQSGPLMWDGGPGGEVTP